MVELGNVVSFGKMRNSYGILVEKPDRELPLGRHKHRWGIILKGI
jgi:hypothetical protein